MNPVILKILKKVYFLSSRVVIFKPRETVCPVCEYLSMVDKTSVRVLRTSKEGIRYCECEKCGSHFRAFKEVSEDKIEKVQQSCTNKEKSVKTKSKAGKTDVDKHSRSRTSTGKQCNRGNS